MLRLSQSLLLVKSFREATEISSVAQRTMASLVYSGLSEWMHPSVHSASHFGDCFRGIRNYFNERRLAPPSSA